MKDVCCTSRPDQGQTMKRCPPRCPAKGACRGINLQTTLVELGELGREGLPNKKMMTMTRAVQI